MVIIDPTLSFTCKMTNDFQFFWIFIFSPWLSMNLNIVLLTSDTALSFAHILKLEAFGDIFFPVVLKFLIEIELLSNKIFPPMIRSTDVRNVLKCSPGPELQDGESNILKIVSNFFRSKIFKMFNFFSLNLPYFII